MGFLSLILVVASADSDDGLAKKMLPIYRKEVAEYSITVESAPKKELELKNEPILEWSNPIRARVQQGVIFLWLRDGRPSALGCFFSVPDSRLPGRSIYHEFHALDREKLLVSRSDALNEWRPQAGLARKELPDAEEPATTRGARLVQMRRLGREFTGYEISAGSKGERGELRLLPAPLYRYPEAGSAVVDGALFAFVSTVGTDPEVLLLIEAHKVGAKTRWEYACGRFSNWDLYVQHKGKEVWSSVLSENNTRRHDPLHTYCNYPDKVVSLEGKVLTRLRSMSNPPVPPKTDK
ncbi:MAG TPA: hypothetical protein VH592_16725 [Gemmataceae bacterium]|jgi:hypothetical protein